MTTETSNQRAEIEGALRETLEQVIQRDIAPRAADIDAVNEFPADVRKAMGDAGLFAVWVPEEYGGADTSITFQLEMLERIARVSATASLIFATTGECAHTILAGSDAVKREYLPAIADGSIIPCGCLTEPGAGSDAGSLRTKAVRVDGGWRLSGAKQFSTTAAVGDVYTVWARTDPDSRHGSGISAFLVPRQSEGLSVGAAEDLIGLRGSANCPVYLDDVFVPDGMLLGEEGKGFELGKEMLDVCRLVAGAIALGLARGALDCAAAYSRERVQFGKPIIDHQAVQFLLANTATGIFAGRSMLRVAAEAIEDGRATEARLYASMTKAFVTDMAMQGTIDSIQAMGGYGLTKNFPVERMMRDAKAWQIIDGTNEIQRMLIGRFLKDHELPD